MTSFTDESDVADTKSAEAEVPLPTAGKAAQHPIVGPALWTFGAMLWAYVVLGEYTTAGFIDEAIAVSLLTFAAGACWYLAVRRGPMTAPFHAGILGRKILPGIIALLLAAGCALFMNFIGESSQRNLDVPMSLAFMVLGMLTFFGGQRLTGSGDNQTSPKAFAHLPLIGAILVSLGAVLHLIVSN